ncbi:HD domain-containing protein [Silvibacterium sp.]|uniref:HD domain-containing protein n=1 Tax=Silvibacterium sp. TaxID=1964179 RepID=UPI0039E4D06B
MQPVERVISFVLAIEDLKRVTRKVRPLGLDRYENSAEHSWQLALFAYALAPHAGFALDLDRVIRMLLVHDLGEIDTGDTMAFVEGGWEQRKADELAAVKRIFSLLPDGQAAELLQLWQEFETGTTPEARFANAVDRAMPVLLNLNNHGQSWRENDISYERILKRVRGQILEGCPQLWDYLETRLSEARESGFFDWDAGS